MYFCDTLYDGVGKTPFQVLVIQGSDSSFVDEASLWVLIPKAPHQDSEQGNILWWSVSNTVNQKGTSPSCMRPVTVFLQNNAQLYEKDQKEM